MTVGVVVLIAVLALTTAYGVLRRRRAGARRDVAAVTALTEDDLGLPLGERATLLQFSSAFCRPCVATRHVLDAVAELMDGVERRRAGGVPRRHEVMAALAEL
jgi:hypothetical protein